jgi:hypothetical protein
MREEFEAWGLENHFEVGHKSADGRYIGPATDIAWTAWQASRAAVVVELPKNELSMQGHDRWRARQSAIDSCKTAIQSTGIRVK